MIVNARRMVVTSGARDHLLKCFDLPMVLEEGTKSIGPAFIRFRSNADR